MSRLTREQELSQFKLPTQLPAHIAMIMDGNGRWALQRHLPRIAGHRSGMQTVRRVIEACAHWQINALTLFAFSSENWNRPAQEVQFLMGLFQSTLRDEIEELHANNIRLRVIGDVGSLNVDLQQAITLAMEKTAQNSGLNLSIAINYGGRADITLAMKKIAQKISQGLLSAQDINEDLISQHLSLADLPAPDLFIRTSGELRLSNFMLWQFAYTELYFTDVFWPDFNEATLHEAICAYAKRERRYGFATKPEKVLEHA